MGSVNLRPYNQLDKWLNRNNDASQIIERAPTNETTIPGGGIFVLFSELFPKASWREVALGICIKTSLGLAAVAFSATIKNAIFGETTAIAVSSGMIIAIPLLVRCQIQVVTNYLFSSTQAICCMISPYLLCLAMDFVSSSMEMSYNFTASLFIFECGVIACNLIRNKFFS